MLLGYALIGERVVAKIRSKGILLHSKAITSYCEQFAVPTKKKQGFIKTAKKTGHDLGFLIPGGHFGDGLVGEKGMELYEQSGIDKW